MYPGLLAFALAGCAFLPVELTSGPLARAGEPQGEQRPLNFEDASRKVPKPREIYAHKPWVLKHDGIVYHFYCAVGDRGRVIALATSKPLP